MPHHVIPDHIKERARSLRKNQTHAEKIIRNQLKNRKLGGIKRYRQFPLNIGDETGRKRYIADFRSHQLQLVIEIDGEYHNTPGQQVEYALRTEMIEGLGIHVIRFTNNQVKNNIEEVRKEIQKYALSKQT